MNEIIQSRQKAQTGDTLNPWEHSDEISYRVVEDVSGVRPFGDVNNAADFGKKLRTLSWDRANYRQHFQRSIL